MDAGERTTGTRDEHYNLISVLYHALHGAQNCDTYAIDAEVAGDERLAEFFHEAWAQQIHLAERAKGLLGLPVDTTTTTPHTAEVGTSIPPEGLTREEVRPSTEAPVHGAVGPVEPGPEVPPEDTQPPPDLPPRQ